MSTKFVMCIDNENYPIDLTIHLVYKTVYDESVDKRGWICVVDNSGEDYLYPARKFMPVQIPEEAEQSFGKVAPRSFLLQGAHKQERQRQLMI